MSKSQTVLSKTFESNSYAEQINIVHGIATPMKGKTIFFVNSNFLPKSISRADQKTLFDSTAGNTGNSYIFYALLRLLRPSIYGYLNNVYHLPDQRCLYELADAINSGYDCLTLILQDQIRCQESYGYKLPYKKLIDFLGRVHVPIFIPSIGANSPGVVDPLSFAKSLDEDLVLFLRSLADMVPVLGVRGHWTKQILNVLGITNVVATGCPTFIESRYSSSFAVPTSLGEIFLTSPMPLASQYNLNVVLQDEQWLVSPIVYESFSSDTPFAGVYPLGALKCLFSKSYYYFTNIDNWKSFCSNYKVAIGGRVHGSLVALSMGAIPILINDDMRSHEMFNLLGLKVLTRNDFSRQLSEYTSLLDFIKSRLDAHDHHSFLSKQQRIMQVFGRFCDAHMANLLYKNSTQQEDLFINCSFGEVSLYSETHYLNLSRFMIQQCQRLNGREASLCF